MPRKTIEAVHDVDLRGLLQSLGLLAEVLEGNAACAFCGSPITLENLTAVFSNSGAIALTCSSVNCLSQMNDVLAGPNQGQS